MSLKKFVVYTCITGGYDILHEIKFVSPDIDYICFTDNAKLQSKTWKVLPLPNDLLNIDSAVKKQRLIKILPHKYLSSYEASLWVDSNIEVIGDLKDFFAKYDLTKKILYVNRHPSRDCIYREQLAIVRLNKDTFENTAPQINRYRDEGFPEHYGLAETNILLRKHNDKRCIKLMETWANEIKNGSHRDQLSFNYSIWKCDLKDYVEYLSEKYYNLHFSDNAFFILKNHKKDENYKQIIIVKKPVEAVKIDTKKTDIEENQHNAEIKKETTRPATTVHVDIEIPLKKAKPAKPVSVVVFTHNRTNVASETIKSLFRNLKYSGELNWVLADDRSTDTHLKNLDSLFKNNKIGYTLCKTTSERFGLGASMNIGLQTAFKKSDIVLRVEDDWILEKRLELDRFVKTLEDNSNVAGIRLGMVNGGVITDTDLFKDKTYKPLLASSDKTWVFVNQIALIHKRVHDVLGWYLENIGADKSEEEFKDRYNKATENGKNKKLMLLAPSEMKWNTMDDPSLWFIHVGRSTLGHMVYREPKRYRWLYERTPVDLSIVVPCYNVEKYIESCLSSLLNQNTRYNYEIICVENGSTDKTKSIIESFAASHESIFVASSEKSLGLARNKGLDISSGKFVSFVDGDDTVSSAYVDNIVRAMLIKNLDVCYFAMDMFRDGTNDFKKLDRIAECIKRAGIDFSKTFSTTQLKDVDFNVSQCTQAYRREFLSRNSLRFSNAKFGEDTLFFLNVFPKISKCFYIDKVLYHYRINRPNSLMYEAEKDISMRKNWASLVCNEFNNKIANKISKTEEEKYRIKIKKEISYYLKDFDFSTLIAKKKEWIWPTISVMMTTHNRTAVASFVLDNLIKKLKYSGSIHWIVCDDRSLPGHIEVMRSKFVENNISDYSILCTDAKHWGLGASMNNGLKDAFTKGDIVLTTEDDWYLRSDYRIDDKVKLLIEDENVAGVRIGALCNELGGMLKQDLAYKEYYKVEAQKGKNGRFYIFNNQVMIRHRRIFDKIGYMRENCSSDMQEAAMVATYNKLTDFGRSQKFKTLWPKGYDIATLYGAHNPFFHIGRSTTNGKNRPIRKDFTYLNNDKLDEELRNAFIDDKKQSVFFKVVIPSYNVEKYIVRCIESVEKQTFKNYHIVVADDMSTDKTRGILTDLQQKYKNLTVCYLDRKKCAGGARNTAMKMQPTSWYTIFIDADDYLIDSTAFQQIYDCIKKKNNPDCIEISYRRELDKGKTFDVIARSKTVNDLLRGRIFAPWRKVIRTAILKDFKEDRLRANDVVWTFRQADVTNTIERIEKPLIFYSTSNPISGWNGEKKNKADLDKAIELLRKDLEEESYSNKVVDEYRRKEVELIKKKEGIYSK